MQLEISITDEDISYAEIILLPVGKTFDDERRNFIRNLDVIDLQAVPGSGKTTALLAKLIILERKLPFSGGSGILVLSHTNAAIDEIKERILKYCPKLFSYPNFIGTIQSFVDEFLAIPFYTQSYNKKLNRIDNEIFDEFITNRFNNLPISSAKNWLMRKHNPESFFRNLRFDVDLNLTEGINGRIVLNSATNSGTYRAFKIIKNQILKAGILNYDDAYFLAEVYLKKVPKMKNILQERFSFVFVDEMQDMDLHQYNLLEKIFYDDENSISKMQRIGDKNQAIYNSVKSTDVWVDRTTVLRLVGSQRLSEPIANVVKNFALYSDANFDIVGLNECVLKPHILIFENAGISNIIPRFAQLVKDNDLVSQSKAIKVVCWNTDWKEDNISRQDNLKLRLEDYHMGFTKDKNKPKQDYECLKSYLLLYDKNKRTLEPIRKNILNAFLKILRLENINSLDQRPYTKKKMIDYIKEKDLQKYEELNLNLYNWSIGIIKGNTNDVWNDIKIYLPDLIDIFSANITSVGNTFINNVVVQVVSENLDSFETTNNYKDEDLEIEITSVHAVKGQTHCATLYLESYFQRDGTGVNAKSYESQRLAQQFLGNQFQPNVGDRIKQSTKMIYVGFSRPTDLLCVAIHKDRFDQLLSEIDRNQWEIILV